jgi:hypothetical protein
MGYTSFLTSSCTGISRPTWQACGILLKGYGAPQIESRTSPPFRCFNSSPEVIRLVVLM